jgi:RloB-like protein
MGAQGQAKHRQQARDLRRQGAKRGLYERLLIVCEGSKTEPAYLEEIRSQYRLSTANVMVLHSEFGTDPMSVVKYAEQIFKEGDSHAKIKPKEFDRVFVVFDRDDHHNYALALETSQALHQKMRNDEKRFVSFQPIASVPCFELWLLLHFEDVLAPIHRQEVVQRLCRYLPNYEKGQGGHWQATQSRLDQAIQRALNLTISHTNEGVAPWTAMHELVDYLRKLKA